MFEKLRLYLVSFSLIPGFSEYRLCGSGARLDILVRWRCGICEQVHLAGSEADERLESPAGRDGGYRQLLVQCVGELGYHGGERRGCASHTRESVRA